MSCCGDSKMSNAGGEVFETEATANTTGTGFQVRGSEKLNYSFSFVDNVFDTAKEDLAKYYERWGRVLVIMDKTVYGFYGKSVEKCE